MPQELQVVRCFSCETYQVDIVKKIPKWCCKLCGEKQSLKKIYGKGTGKECRILVQTLNEQRCSKDMLSTAPESSIVSAAPVQLPNKQKQSKWEEFTKNSPEEEFNGKPLAHNLQTSTQCGLNLSCQDQSKYVDNPQNTSKKEVTTDIASVTKPQPFNNNIFEDIDLDLDSVFNL